MELPENNYATLIRFLLSTRRFLLELIAIMGCLTTGFLFFTPKLLAWISTILGQKLVFFEVAEPIIAIFKFSIVLAIITILPWFFIRFSLLLERHFGLQRGFAVWLCIASLFLFYAGASFSAFLTLPFGIKFLLGFQSEKLQAAISVMDFVDFVTLFTLGFGFIFELPLIMIVLARLGIVSAEQFAAQRAYAIFGIAILSAFLTPTPDVFNMSLMALPLYLLFETGIVFARILGKNKKS